MSSGPLPARKWTRVLYGWGKYSLGYSVQVGHGVRGQYRCYTTPLPWPVSSGELPAQVTHHVYGYGDVWLYAEEATNYHLVPVGP